MDFISLYGGQLHNWSTGIRYNWKANYMKIRFLDIEVLSFFCFINLRFYSCECFFHDGLDECNRLIIVMPLIYKFWWIIVLLNRYKFILIFLLKWYHLQKHKLNDFQKNICYKSVSQVYRKLWRRQFKWKQMYHHKKQKVFTK